MLAIKKKEGCELQQNIRGICWTTKNRQRRFLFASRAITIRAY